MMTLMYILFMLIGVVSSVAWCVHVFVWFAKHSTGKNVALHFLANILIFMIAARLGESIMGLL